MPRKKPLKGVRSLADSRIPDLFRAWNEECKAAIKGGDDITDWKQTKFPYLAKEINSEHPHLRAELERIKIKQR